MDTVTLKKKLSAYVSDKGYLKNVSDELHFEVLVAWENWTGPSKEFYRSLGFTHSQMAGLIGKAKRMKREGLLWSRVKRKLSPPAPFPVVLNSPRIRCPGISSSLSMRAEPVASACSM